MLFSEYFVHPLNITFTSGVFCSQQLFGHVNFVFTHPALLFPSDSYYFFDTFYINADQTGNLLAADTLFMQGDNGFSVVNWYHCCHPYVRLFRKKEHLPRKRSKGSRIDGTESHVASGSDCSKGSRRLKCHRQLCRFFSNVSCSVFWPQP